jgi:hypothetical protein
MKMAEHNQSLSRHDLEARIVKRCWEHDDFRKEFVANPAGAFVKYLGVPVSDLPKIVVYDEMSGSWHIVLPARPAELIDSGELSDEELERIAGGVTSLACVTLGVSITTLSATVSAQVTRALDCW